MAGSENKQRGITPDPAESNRHNQKQQTQETGEGQFRNAETQANRAADFDDDFESSQENQIAEEESRTEKEGQTGKS
jgi:hypothetical protein